MLEILFLFLLLFFCFSVSLLCFLSDGGIIGNETEQGTNLPGALSYHCNDSNAVRNRYRNRKYRQTIGQTVGVVSARRAPPWHRRIANVIGDIIQRQQAPRCKAQEKKWNRTGNFNLSLYDIDAAVYIAFFPFSSVPTDYRPLTPPCPTSRQRFQDRKSVV